MNFKRAIITLMVLMLLPGLAMAQDGIGETVRFEVNKIWVDTALGIWPNTGQDVDVEIVCNTGLPLTQQATINSGPNGGVVLRPDNLCPAARPCSLRFGRRPAIAYWVCRYESSAGQRATSHGRASQTGPGVPFT